MIDAITKMLDAFPGERADGMIEVYLEEAQAFDQGVIEKTCTRFIKGQIKRDIRFCPSVPEFLKEAREQKEWLEKADKEIRPVMVRQNVPLSDRLHAKRAMYEGRTIVEEHVSHTRWAEGVKKRQWPAGCEYNAALATVFGPYQPEKRTI